jgi:outer membrane protein TolC
MNKVFALIFGLLAALPVRGETLADALEQAWLLHPQAAALDAREAEAAARAELALGLTPGPAAVSLGNLGDRLNGNRGKDEWEVELAAPLWLPGQQAARQAQAESASAEVAARRAALRLQVAGELREAWWAVAAARNARDMADRRVETASGLEADVERRFKAGDLARVDANLAHNERLAAEAELVDAESVLLQAEQAYRALTGAAAPASLAEEAPPLGEPREDHAQLVAAIAAARAARSSLKFAEQTRRDAPEIAVRLVRDRNDFSEPYANAVGVKLTIPFASAPRVRQETLAATAQAAEADAELAQARLKLQLGAEKTRAELDAAERQLAIAKERRALTADTLRLMEKSFALGESDLTTLLRVRTSAFEADALFNRQQVARAAAQSRLKQALGVLP